MKKVDKNLTTIYIVRHGESQSNVDEILAGHHDSLLTPTGENQARETARVLRHVKFDAVFSSDLLRTKRTAEIIMLERSIAVQTTRALRERHYGQFEGKPYDLYNKAVEALLQQYQKLAETDRFRLSPHGVESRESVFTRFITFIREIAVAYAGKNVLLVTHGGVMRYFMIKIGFATNKELYHGIKNAAYIKLKSDGVDFFVTETKGIEKISNV